MGFINPGSKQKTGDVPAVQLPIELLLHRESPEGLPGQFYIQVTVFVDYGYMGEGEIELVLTQIYRIGIDPNTVAVELFGPGFIIGVPLIGIKILRRQCQPSIVLFGVPVELEILVEQLCSIDKIPNPRLIKCIPIMP